MPQIGWWVDCGTKRVAKESIVSCWLCGLSVPGTRGCETVMHAQLEGGHGDTVIWAEKISVYWKWTADLEVRGLAIWWSLCGECSCNITGLYYRNWPSLKDLFEIWYTWQVFIPFFFFHWGLLPCLPVCFPLHKIFLKNWSAQKGEMPFDKGEVDIFDKIHPQKM